jgi:hypothetical protein
MGLSRHTLIVLFTLLSIMTLTGRSKGLAWQTTSSKMESNSWYSFSSESYGSKSR